MIFNICTGYSLLSSSVHFLLLLVLLSAAYVVVFYCEGLKIAIVSSSSDEATMAGSKIKVCELIADQKDGVARFLLGRQMIVVPLGFLVASITHFTSCDALRLNYTQCLFLVGLGLPGMLVTMQLAQLAPQVLASKNNKSFLQLPGAFCLVYFALAIELLGITEFAFLFRRAIEALAHTKQAAKLSSTTGNNDACENFEQQQQEEGSSGDGVSILHHAPVGVKDRGQFMLLEQQSRNN